MILLIHRNAREIDKVLKDGASVDVRSRSCVEALWELAERYPDEIIGWCEKELEPRIALEEWYKVFHHDLIMASYAVRRSFLPSSIGYVDQMPFAKVNPEVLYGTWQMSADIGGVKGKVLLKFHPLLKERSSLRFVLNSIAKLGQQNSLFCYSAPALLKLGCDKEKEVVVPTASFDQLFSFVYGHYSTVWTLILFWCIFKYERHFPISAFFRCFFDKKFFKRSVDLSGIQVQSTRKMFAQEQIDVIIPTMGRPKFLYQVLKDFSLQTLLPAKIIIVEQNSSYEAVSNLQFIYNEEWPFEIVHHFIHRTGACNARNLALAEISSQWIFLSDDDQRFEKDLIRSIFSEIKKYGVDGLTTSYLQVGENKQFQSPKQWGSFGAGNSVVSKEFVEKAFFSPALEFGYGEDKDFGMQLRNAGCDVIYHPGLEIIHLKAPIGGFREKQDPEWQNEEPSAKPSPTLMIYMLRHYTTQQMKGFKTSLFLRYYFQQNIKNPFAYIRSMKKRWKRSEKWATRIVDSIQENYENGFKS